MAMVIRAVTIATLLVAAPARAEPRGAIGAGSELAVLGDGLVQRVDATAIVYVTRRLGLEARAGRITPDGAHGVATAGVAYRAAAARPKLEVVIDLAVGVAWPTAPAATAGVTGFLWPTRLPIALTLSARTYALPADDAPLGFSLGLGLALAR